MEVEMKKRFNVNVHGNREAQRLAIQYRKAKEKQLQQEWNKKRAFTKGQGQLPSRFQT